MSKVQKALDIQLGYVCVWNDDYLGQICQCAGCTHPDGICIDHSEGSGCAACEGIVSNCNWEEALKEDSIDE